MAKFRPPAEYDPYRRPEDHARLEYGRLLWKVPRVRRRLLEHWTDPRHPWRDRFLRTWRPLVERLLAADPESDEELDRELRQAGHSLRMVMREIPPVFGGFY
ncbi:MAG: hypothetical protein KDM91_03695 [Verrucomicrobiae bacterium]|nr:hypothetical protein [Verrucomicrobiae bacterium]MCP5540009.1 hypothetical protein [Akkermansiaceae bacterium]MCP5549944.1 hypothetical protein [Akkermansiaceae bacterium]